MTLLRLPRTARRNQIAQVMNNLAIAGFGDTPVLDLNFVGSANPLPASITFTRASGGTRINSSGFLELLASNEPRFDYDPVTLAAKGLLIEEQRTNQQLQGNNFSTGWGGTASQVQDILGIDGGTTGWTITDSSAAASQYKSYVTPTLTAGSYTLSLYVKKTVGAQSSYPIIDIYSGTNLSAVTVDTSNGIATLWTAYTGFTIVGISASCVSHNTNYWRVAMVFTATATAHTVEISPAATTNATQSTGVKDATPQGSAGFTCVQLESGSFATSYIPTTTAAVTRAADFVTMSGTGFTSIWNESEGTIVTESEEIFPGNSAATLCNLDDGTVNNRYSIGTSAGLRSIFSAPAPTISNSFATPAILNNTAQKAVLAYKLNDANMAFAGTVKVADTTMTPVPGVNQMRFGVSVSGAASSWSNMHMRRFTYYNRRLPDATLQALSA